MFLTSGLILLRRHQIFCMREDTLNPVTVIRIKIIPNICKPASLSWKITTPNKDAVTGSIIATTDATAGAVFLSPTM